MCEILINDLVEELSEENKRLLNVIQIERQFVCILDNIRNNALVLIQNCKCDENQHLIQTIHTFNHNYNQLTSETSLKPLLQDITRGGTPKRAKQSLNTSRR